MKQLFVAGIFLKPFPTICQVNVTFGVPSSNSGLQWTMLSCTDDYRSLMFMWWCSIAQTFTTGKMLGRCHRGICQTLLWPGRFPVTSPKMMVNYCIRVKSSPSGWKCQWFAGQWIIMIPGIYHDLYVVMWLGMVGDGWWWLVMVGNGWWLLESFARRISRIKREHVKYLYDEFGWNSRVEPKISRSPCCFFGAFGGQSPNWLKYFAAKFLRHSKSDELSCFSVGKRSLRIKVGTLARLWQHFVNLGIAKLMMLLVFVAEK